MKPPITERPDDSWLDAKHFENRRNFPPEELDKYRGQQIAWSWDGTRIIASGKDLDEVFQNLDAAGVDASRVVFSYVDDL